MARDLTGTRDLMDVDMGLQLEAPSVHDIYDAGFGRLAGWTTRLVGDPDLAHDFATEAFVRLLRNRTTVVQPSPAPACTSRWRTSCATTGESVAGRHHQTRPVRRQAFGKVYAAYLSRQSNARELEFSIETQREAVAEATSVLRS